MLEDPATGSVGSARFGSRRQSRNPRAHRLVQVAENALGGYLGFETGDAERISGLEFLKFPCTSGAAVVVFDASLVRIDENEFAQRRNPPVSSELIAAIVSCGGGGEHFDDYGGCANEVFGLVIGWVAGDDHVRVEIRLIGLGLEFHVGHVGAAGGVLKHSVQGGKNVAGDGDVQAAGATHGESFTMEILVTAGLFGFPGEIVGRGELRCRLGQGHDGAPGAGAIKCPLNTSFR